MSKLGDRMRAAYSKRLGVKDVIEQFDGMVTLNGVKEVQTKNGPTYVFTIVEGDNLSLWGGSAGLQIIVKILMGEGEDKNTLAEVDKMMKVTGQRIKIEKEKIINKDGKPQWDIKWLGEVNLGISIVPDKDDDEEEVDYDPETGEVRDGAPF